MVGNLDGIQQQEPRFPEVGKVDEVPVGKKKYVEVEGKD
jgi:hypothetical protein